VLLVAWHTTIYVCEIKEELDADITVGELIETAQYDYSTFHLTMHCFLCELVSDHVVLLEQLRCWSDAGTVTNPIQ